MKSPGMHRTVALLLQGAIVLVGFIILTFLLVEPHFEGRNAHATVLEVYSRDPFLAYVYVGSIAFFVALGRAVALLGEVRRTGSFSQGSVDRLQGIKRCGFVLIGFIAGAGVFIILFGDGEDRPAGVFMCLLATAGAGGIAAAAAFLARSLQGALARRKAES